MITTAHNNTTDPRKAASSDSSAPLTWVAPQVAAAAGRSTPPHMRGGWLDHLAEGAERVEAEVAPAWHWMEGEVVRADAAAFRTHPMWRFLVGALLYAEVGGLFGAGRAPYS
jgi:hypothetical protein